MECIATFKFKNAGEAEVFADVLKTYPAADRVEEAGRIGDGNIVLVRAVGKKAVKDILAAAAETIVTEGKYPWKKPTEEE